jgi:hypothetical protein
MSVPILAWITASFVAASLDGLAELWPGEVIVQKRDSRPQWTEKTCIKMR